MILVTGATGNVGRGVVEGLRERGVAVRALTRDPGKAGLPEDVEVVAGDLARPETLGPALDGVEAVFLVWPSVQADHAAEQAIGRITAKVSRIVYLSARGVPDDPAVRAEGILGSHQLLERLIRDSGVTWTFLRGGGFAANTRGWAAQIQAGDVVRWFHGQAARSLIHERDIADVAVRTLTEPGHDGATYELTGPRTLTQIEQVHAIGEAIGRPLHFEELPRAAAIDMLAGTGLPESMATGIVDAHAAMADSPETTTNTVERLLGHPARTYHQWALDHAALYQP